MTDNRDEAWLCGAFTAYRHGLGPQVRPAGAAAAYQAVQRRRQVRAVVIAVVITFVLVGPVTAYTVASAAPAAPPITGAGAGADVLPSTPPGPAVSPPQDLTSGPGGGSEEPPRASPEPPQISGRADYLNNFIPDEPAPQPNRRWW